jgi:hypothetical protein
MSGVLQPPLPSYVPADANELAAATEHGSPSSLLDVEHLDEIVVEPIDEGGLESRAEQLPHSPGSPRSTTRSPARPYAWIRSRVPRLQH